MTKKLELGDIFELETKKGLAYLQYVKEPKDQNEIEKVRIFYDLHNKRPSQLKDTICGEFFFLSFILKSAFKEGIVKKIGNISIPNDLTFPSFMRTEHLFKDDWWQIVNVKTWERESIENLTDEQKKLSPWGTWNDTLLIENLENGWRLENWI